MLTKVAVDKVTYVGPPLFGKQAEQSWQNLTGRYKS